MSTTAASVPRSPADTADVLAAVWNVPSDAPTLSLVDRLYLPDADSTEFAASETVRALLVPRGVPRPARRPAGHDTIVYRFGRWRRDSTGALVVPLTAGWTLMSRTARPMCLTGANLETYRVRRARGGWSAERVGPVLHGNGYCTPGPRAP